MRIKWKVQVFAQVSCGAATPVLKDVQIGLPLILQEKKREGDDDDDDDAVNTFRSGTINPLTSLLSKLKPTNTHLLRYHLKIQ